MNLVHVALEVAQQRARRLQAKYMPEYTELTKKLSPNSGISNEEMESVKRRYEVFQKRHGKSAAPPRTLHI